MIGIRDEKLKQVEITQIEKLTLSSYLYLTFSINSNQKPNREISGYYDASIWETARKKGDTALKRLINRGLSGTSNTCVLIGSFTYARPWVRYEIMKSFKKGNHIFGVHINSIKDKKGNTKRKGANPFEYLAVSFSKSGRTASLLEYKNGRWVRYEKIDGSSSYRLNVQSKYRGKCLLLSRLFSTFDWVRDKGYRNFPKWVH